MLRYATSTHQHTKSWCDFADHTQSIGSLTDQGFSIAIVVKSCTKLALSFINIRVIVAEAIIYKQ